MTKDQALRAVDHLGAFEASEQLCGMLSMAIETGKDTSGVEAAIETIDRQLNEWASLKKDKPCTLCGAMFLLGDSTCRIFGHDLTK